MSPTQDFGLGFRNRSTRYGAYLLLLMAPTILFSCLNRNPCWAGDLVFRKHVINAQSEYSAAGLVDVNHDGVVDVVCGGDWYQTPDWDRHYVADIPRIGGRFDGYSHLELDVNRDGWTDIITVNYRSRSIRWMEHPGPKLGPWRTHIAAEPGPMETGRLVDVDGDGQVDVLPNGTTFAAWFELRWNPESRVGAPAWIQHDLPKEAAGHGIGFGDIDGDGRGDIVARNGWLQAPRDRRHGRWIWHPEYRLERASIPMIVDDVDGDGDGDIVTGNAHGFGVFWLEQSIESNGQRRWVRHTIDTSWSQGHSPLWRDMDGDGRPELIVGKRYMAHGGADPGEYDPIAIYRYQFEPRTRSWRRWTMSPPGNRVGVGLDPKIADLDRDGDLDYLAAGRSGLYWLENLGPPTSKPEPNTIDYDDHLNLLVEKTVSGELRKIVEPEGWGRRRMHIVQAIERQHGRLPDCLQRIALQPNWTDPLTDPVANQSDANEVIDSQQGLRRGDDSGLQDKTGNRGESNPVSMTGTETRSVTYRVDGSRTAKAQLVFPKTLDSKPVPAIVVCMDPSNDTEDERGRWISEQIAQRGYVALHVTLTRPSETRPSDDALVFNRSVARDPIIDGVWQMMRAADLLQGLEMVDIEKIGFVGGALQGRLGLYTAALDQRFLVTVTELDRPMPRIGGDRYSLAELIAAAAPRHLQVRISSDHPLVGELDRHVELARKVYHLRSADDRLVVERVPEEAASGDSQSGTFTKSLNWLDQSLHRR